MPNGKVKLFRYVVGLVGYFFLRLRCICHSANKKMTNDLCNIQSNTIEDIFYDISMHKTDSHSFTFTIDKD